MSPEAKRNHIVVVPGLGDTTVAMQGVAAELDAAGLHAHVFAYPQKEWTIDHAALALASYVEMNVLKPEAGRSVSVVGFGTGSLVARCYLAHYEVMPARRCVLVVSPKHTTDTYRGKTVGWFGRWRHGVVLQQLAEGPAGFPGSCGHPPVPYGVIVTNTSLPATADKLDNEMVKDSIYAPPALLKGARAVQYDAVPTGKAASERRIRTYIGAFLQHGWFVEN